MIFAFSIIFLIFIFTLPLTYLIFTALKAINLLDKALYYITLEYSWFLKEHGLEMQQIADRYEVAASYGARNYIRHRFAWIYYKNMKD